MRKAQQKLERSQKTCVQILEEAAQGECIDGCNGQWLACACEVLQQNGIRKETFTKAIKELLEKGRSKFRNVMICGPANTGKTFLLNPLTSVYRTFCNPTCIFCVGWSGRCRMHFLKWFSLVISNNTVAWFSSFAWRTDGASPGTQNSLC